MKTAVVQMKSGPDKDKNIRQSLRLVQRAVDGGATWILLPEVFNYRGLLTLKQLRDKIAEDIPGESTRPLCDLARRNRVAILAGSVYERIPGKDKVFNTSALISHRGRISALYRKRNLFDARVGGLRICESSFFEPGQDGTVGRIAGWKAGLSVCYDLRFPCVYRHYAREGCQVLTVPSAFTRETGRAHWEVLLRARAIENLCYVLAPNQTGIDHRGVAAYGHSMIVSPWGEVLSRATGTRSGVIFADLDQRAILKARKHLPKIC